MGLDGGPVDVGDAGFESIGQVGEQPMGVSAVGGDEGLDSPGAHDLPDRDDWVSGWGPARVVRVHGWGVWTTTAAWSCLHIGPVAGRLVLTPGEGVVFGRLVTPSAKKSPEVPALRPRRTGEPGTVCAHDGQRGCHHRSAG